MQLIACALILALLGKDESIAASKLMIAITTNISISVNAPSLRIESAFQLDKFKAGVSRRPQ